MSESLEIIGPQKRAIAYVDGFNLYHGLRSSGLRKFYWLDISSLCRQLVKPDTQLVNTKYFSARISGAVPGDSSLRAASLNAKRKRQADYLEALGTIQGLELHFGKYQDEPKQCLHCHRSWIDHEEKMTDVNIATQLLLDAVDDRFEVAFVVSGDSDLTPPLKAIRERCPNKRILVAFPPNRSSVELQKIAHGFFYISEKALAKSQLPTQVAKDDGFVLKRPTQWM